MDVELAFSRLTGRHILGPGVFFTTLAYSFVAHLLGSADLQGGNLGLRFMAVFVAHLAMMLIAYVVYFSAKKLSETSFGLTLVVTGFIIAGAIRGLLLQYMLFEFHLSDQAFMLFRLYGGVVTVGAGLLWAIFAFGLKAEWAAKQAKLKASQKQLEQLLAETEGKLDLEATDTMSTIESMLQTALIPELMVTPQHAVIKLQALINDTLRPLSAYLAASQPTITLQPLDPSLYRFRWTGLIRNLKLADAAGPVFIPIVLSTLAINFFLKYLPDESPIVLGSFAIVALAAPLLIEKYLVSRWVDRLRDAIRVPLIFVLLAATGGLAGLSLVFLYPENRAMIDLAIDAAISVALSGALVGINQSATVEMSVIEGQLLENEHRLRWNIAALNAQHWLQKKQFARKIHGPVQSEVAAAAIRIERSLSSGELNESGEMVLQNLRDRLAKILRDTKGIAEMRPVLAEITETWQGLCNIQVDLPTGVEVLMRQDPVCVETVLEIVREACSNAIRHGSADEIKLEFSRRTLDLIGLRVTNNGGRGLDSSRRGLGSVYLDDCTYSHELEITEFGAVLNALVPIRIEQ